MQRNMPKIVGLLKSIDMKRDEGGGAVFPDGYFDDPQNAHEKHFLPLLIEAGFVAEVAGQAEICDFKKLTNGIESEVYDIGHHIVKIRRNGDVPFECVKWAVDIRREHQVKVP